MFEEVSHITTSRRFRGRSATSFDRRERTARHATSEKRQRFLKGGILNFKIVKFLLEGGDLWSVRGIAAWCAAVAQAEQPIGRYSKANTKRLKNLNGRKAPF